MPAVAVAVASGVLPVLHHLQRIKKFAFIQ